MSFATLLAIGTALNPVAPINGFIFFFVVRLNILTAKIPPIIDIMKANNPPIIIPKVCIFKKDSGVIVAPIDNPKKIVLVFKILLEAALDSLFVVDPISLIKFPNIKKPINGVEEFLLFGLINSRADQIARMSGVGVSVPGEEYFRMENSTSRDSTSNPTCVLRHW